MPRPPSSPIVTYNVLGHLLSICLCDRAITPMHTRRESEGDFGGPAQGSVGCVNAITTRTGSPEGEDPGDMDLGGPGLESDDEEAPPLETPGSMDLEFSVIRAGYAFTLLGPGIRETVLEEDEGAPNSTPEGSRSGGRESPFLKWGSSSKANDSNEFQSGEEREIDSPNDQEVFPLTIEQGD